MRPQVIKTARLTLDQPGDGDRDAIVEYCRDPLFERYMTLPWPYEPRHADHFVDELVPLGWSTGSEYTWVLRSAAGGPLLGAIGYRMARADIGYWLGAPHRGRGLMTEAMTAVADWLFTSGQARIVWECVVGNRASAAVARNSGFTFTGERPTELTFRDGSHPAAWHGELFATDDRTVKAGWPT